MSVPKHLQLGGIPSGIKKSSSKTNDPVIVRYLNLVRTTRFWNNLRQVRSNQKLYIFDFSSSSMFFLLDFGIVPTIVLVVFFAFNLILKAYFS